jgi:hypothetical protein
VYCIPAFFHSTLPSVPAPEIILKATVRVAVEFGTSVTSNGGRASIQFKQREPMKTATNSQAGFIRLTLVFICIIIVLFGMGGQGIYTALKYRQPVALNCEDYTRTKPRAAWLAITNCILDLNDASYATMKLKYQKAEIATELFIPVRSATAKEPAKDNILLMTRDPELMKLLREVESLPTQAKVDEWMARNAERLRVRRDAKGLVQFGVDLNKGERRKLAQLQDSLTQDFIIIEEGRKPEFGQSLGYLALGSMLVVVSVVFVRRNSREPDAAESY